MSHMRNDLIDQTQTPIFLTMVTANMSINTVSKIDVIIEIRLVNLTWP